MRFRIWNSIDSDAPKPNSRKPRNTAFQQQRLEAWQPTISAKGVIPFLVFVSCIFAPIGVGLIIAAIRVESFTVDYSKCELLASRDEFQIIPKAFVSSNFLKRITRKPEWRLLGNSVGGQSCQIRFEVPENIHKSTYAYYKLTNFNQNHRKYANSYDKDQLRGAPLNYTELTNDCDPLREIDGKTVYPCGLIANSLFNDTFAQVLIGINGTDDYSLSSKGIAWKTDKDRYGKTRYNASDIVPPPNWRHRFPNGYTDDNLPDLSDWEEFHVWMRQAGLPHFYKLALKNETHGLKKGTYIMEIDLNFPVLPFDGSKSLVLTTNSIVGGRNTGLGILYLVLACLSVLFLIIFLLKTVLQPMSIKDHAYLNFEVPDRVSDRRISMSLQGKGIF